MQLVSCSAPTGDIEAAPLTSMDLSAAGLDGSATAFWSGDDGYVVRVQGADAIQWYRIDAQVATESPLDAPTRFAMSNYLSNVTSIGRGRVLFPIGSSGRRVYRVWRSGSAGAAARSRILAVRVAASRRRPA